MSSGRAILFGTLAVGVPDILYATINAGARGVMPVRVLQTIASGLLGRDAARAGGYGTAMLGLALHFFIASVVFSLYYLASRKLGVLTRLPLLCGPAYGLMVYFVMYDVVIPLSAIGPRAGPRPLEALLHGFAAHVFCVGLPAALVARRAAG